MVERSRFDDRYVSDMSTEELEVPLYENSRERQSYDEKANLYAIIIATEHLERSYALDAINVRTYTDQCKKLISQFRVAEHIIKGEMTTEDFMHIYQMDCPRAKERLLVQGIPQPVKGADTTNQSATVAGKDCSCCSYVQSDLLSAYSTCAFVYSWTLSETVQYFITTMDAVRLEQRYVDELQPLLSDLMDSLTRLSETPNDFEPNRKVQYWLQKLNALRAVDEIEEGDARQLLHDLDFAYSDFTRYLKAQDAS